MNNNKKAMNTQKKKNLLSCFLFFFVFAVLSLVFTSCPEPFNPSHHETDIPQGYGSFSLRIADNSNGRTILPTAPTSYAVYTLVFTATSGGQNLSVDRTNTTLVTESIILVAGTYTLIVSAYLDTGKTRLAAQGTAGNIIITAGTNASAAVQLKALQSTGTGEFIWSVNITASGVTQATMTISQGGTPLSGYPVTLSNTGTNSGNPSLSSGIYNINFRLVRQNEEAEWNELLYVYSSLTSSFSKTFSNEYFSRSHYNVTFNHNYDSISVPQSVLHGDTIADNIPVRSGFNFLGWYTDAGLTASFDFETVIFNDFTLYAKWEIAGTVTVSKDGGAPTFHLTLNAALASISGAGNFTITLFENHTMTANHTIDTENQHITIVGEGVRTITHGITAVAAHMFTVDNANASLTLGNNVTILGRTATAGAGAVVQMSAGTFTMQGISRIQGHNISGTSGAVFLRGGTFNMRENSEITDVTASSSTNAAVYINNSAATFNMQGGKITANSNSVTATTTTVSGGVTLSSGKFNMTGGSITGNTQREEASDVYIGTTTANSFTISGNAAIGTLKLTATDSSATTGVIVNIGTDGWNGSITRLNLRASYSLETVEDFWTGNARAIFNGINASQVANIELGEFIGSNNTKQTIGPAYILGTSGMLVLANPAVAVTENNVKTNYSILARAFSAIGSKAGEFTVTLLADQTMTALYLISATDQHITIIGEGGVRTITHGISNAVTNMFTINNTNASLTLGENITIQGRTSPGGGSVINIINGTFRMMTGSRITGHVANTSAATAVYLSDSSAIFEMSGGEITANNNTSSSPGGVYFPRGYFIMTGGSITGNTQGTTAEAYDLLNVVYAADRLIIAGNANIGVLRLNAYDLTSYSRVTINPNWTGAITTLNLSSGQTTVETTINYWNGKTVFDGMTNAHLGRIGIGQFIVNNARQAIGDTHTLGADGVLRAN